ncbi:hypothetical protein [Chelatococcus sp. GW1]|uniref:hypothetical protein n=1 Tax=Chelatococcus sp. GW1 TaxID=1211115 RepID=UPI0012F849E9|nr:hypothetical protein [Chelatococcus sp. GW1]
MVPFCLFVIFREDFIMGMEVDNNTIPSSGAGEGAAAARFRDAAQAGSGRRVRGPALAEIPLGAPSVTISYRPDRSVVIHLGDPVPINGAAASQGPSRAQSVAIDIPEEQVIGSWLASSVPQELDEDVRAALGLHLEGVSRRLTEKGERLEDIRALALKALRRDVLTAAACGAVNAVPAMTAGWAADFTPNFFAEAEKLGNPLGKAAATAAQAGAFEHAADVLGCYLLSLRVVPAVGDRFYLAPNVEKLVEPAAKANKAMELGQWQVFRNRFLTNQTGSVRNLLLLPIAVAVEAASSPRTAGVVDKIVNNALRMPGGAIKDGIRYGIEYQAGRYGPLWLFGRRDWEEVYDALKASPPYEPALNAGRKVALLPYDAVRSLGDNLKDAVSVENVALGGWLVGGLSAYAVTRTAVKDAVEGSGASRLWGDAAGRLAAFPLRVPLSGIYDNASIKEAVRTVAGSAMRTVSRTLEGWAGGAPRPAGEAEAPEAVVVVPREGTGDPEPAAATDAPPHA